MHIDGKTSIPDPTDPKKLPLAVQDTLRSQVGTN